MARFFGLIPVCGLALALGAGAAMAQQQRSIVGTWATEGNCGRPISTIVIGPKSLTGEDFFCEFDTVSRKGNVVTWRGACTYGADAPEREEVVARTAGNRLYYRFRSQAGENGPFQRCPQR
jgi:hypothetical protein